MALVGKIAEIEHNLKKGIDYGKLIDEESGRQYSFKAPLDTFRTNERVLFQLEKEGTNKIAVIKSKV